MTIKSNLKSAAAFPIPSVPKVPPALPSYMVQGKRASIVKYAHEMVRDVAKGMAHELYESMMKSNEAYAVWRHFCEDVGRENAEREFVHLALPYLLDDARATLAGMLRMPQFEHLHLSIHDALIKDNLIRGTDGLIPVKKQIEEAYRGRR